MDFLLIAASMFASDGPTLRELYEIIAAPLDQLGALPTGRGILDRVAPALSLTAQVLNFTSAFLAS